MHHFGAKGNRRAALKPYYSDGQATIYLGDAREVLAGLTPESIQCVVTSPPYWGLRKYDAPDVTWSGDGTCRHDWIEFSVPIIEPVQGAGAHWQHREAHNIGPDEYDVSAFRKADRQKHLVSTCRHCGAWRGSYGLEPTIEMYVQHTVEMLEAIRRVLRPDGVVFWNIGDSYASGKGHCFNPGGGDVAFQNYLKDCGVLNVNRLNKSDLDAQGLKPKDLCLVPFRVALAAQEAGWWVRSVIVWAKPNPMPESVTDRPTESHEYILMLTKQARYYWDQEAVRERSSGWKGSLFGDGKSGDAGLYHRQAVHGEPEEATGRNIRSVWAFPAQPYPHSHFAVFPEELPKRCILAATSERGNCPKCGKPWVRLLNKKSATMSIRVRDAKRRVATAKPSLREMEYGKEEMGWSHTVGWQAQCSCGAEPVPAVVLDPFAGSGTTLLAAKKLGRRSIGIDISENYCRMAVERVRQMALGVEA